MDSVSLGKVFSSRWVAPTFKGAFRYLRKHPLNETNAEVIWRTRHKTVYRVRLPNKFDGEEIVWKDYVNKRFWRFFFRYSFTAREFLGYRKAMELGILVPRVLAVGEKRSWTKLRSCFIVTEYVKDSRNGIDFCHDGPLSKDPAKKAYCKQNIHYLAQLHNAGCIHGAALPQNMLWRINRDSRLEVYWIDLAEVRARSGRRLANGIRNDLRALLGNLEFDEETTEQMINYYNRVRKSLSPDAKPIAL